jgi:hypothetical protein
MYFEDLMMLVLVMASTDPALQIQPSFSCMVSILRRNQRNFNKIQLIF